MIVGAISAVSGIIATVCGNIDVICKNNSVHVCSATSPKIDRMGESHFRADSGVSVISDFNEGDLC